MFTKVWSMIQHKKVTNIKNFSDYAHHKE